MLTSKGGARSPLSIQRMKADCLHQTLLPGTSALFADYLYHFDRVSRFYDHPPLDEQALVQVARSVRMPADRRSSVVKALRKRNGDLTALDALAQPETVAVVTGQQVGLFSGPAYTIYKALTAVRIARNLTQQGTRAVPVFWLATEDHDFAEIDHAHTFDVMHRPILLRARGDGNGHQPVGGIHLQDLPLEDLRESMEGFLFKDEIYELVEQSYASGSTYGEAFHRLLERILSGYGLIFLDPMDSDLREIAAPLLLQALQQAPALSEAVLARNAELVEAGYHAQVHFEPQTSLFFLLRDGQRLPLRRNGNEYALESGEIKFSELAANPAALSPNALLRPVMQDYLLPTAAYVGGPAELAYLAQSQVLYRALLGRMPVAAPRSGFTLLDERSRSLLERYQLQAADVFAGVNSLRERIAARLIPRELEVGFSEAAAAIAAQTDRLQTMLQHYDPTLAEAMGRSRNKILYQVDKNRRKAAREALRREQRVQDNADHLTGLIFPEKHLQERYYSLLPFLAKHGLDLIDTLYENVSRGCPDHVLLTV